MAEAISGTKERTIFFERRGPLPKLIACAGARSLDAMRNQLLFHLPTIDSNQLRRSKNPLYLCIIWELDEGGFADSAAYLKSLIEDNAELLAEDEIGIVVNLRKRPAYLERIKAGLQKAESSKSSDDNQKEALSFLDLAMYFAEEGKGILWLADKFYLASIAVAEKIMVDGGRQCSCCKYYYAKFLLDKFPSADTDEAYNILSQVRDRCIGKPWHLGEDEGDQTTVFAAVAKQLHRVLLNTARAIRSVDPPRSDRLCRMAERRADDAEDLEMKAEAITELGISQLKMSNLNNSLSSFTMALDVWISVNNMQGICEGHMHVASALQRFGDYEGAAKHLSTMGALSMQHSLRRQLGRALHLLGELHLLRGRPDLATPHLKEAFSCFMGVITHKAAVYHDFGATSKTSAEDGEYVSDDDSASSQYMTAKMSMGLHELLHEDREKPAYVSDAEQSRLMMAISSGQEKMGSYFRHLTMGGACAVARAQVLEWKLHGDGWWVQRRRHDQTPCPCPKHDRDALDILRAEKLRKSELAETQFLDKMRFVTGAKHLHLPEASWKLENPLGVSEMEVELKED